ncbi:hypothetical protein [Actinomadura sp. 9N407]|uniref:hypothetical protein n=1 Tax=Actinomadura sp. 9N407 TaxID=3375154 RepID=UPI0037A06AA8
MRQRGRGSSWCCGEREHWLRTTGIGTPEDVVGPLLFLLSDVATMTGSVLIRERAFSGSHFDKGPTQ